MGATVMVTFSCDTRGCPNEVDVITPAHEVATTLYPVGWSMRSVAQPGEAIFCKQCSERTEHADT